MANWTMITIEHNYNVEYIDVPFKDALFRDKSNQAHSSINEIITRQGDNSLAFILCTVSSTGRASALQAEGCRFESYTVHH